MAKGRASRGARPLVRTGVESEGERLRRRYGWGESLAKMCRGKVSAGVAILCESLWEMFGFVGEPAQGGNFRW